MAKIVLILGGVRSGKSDFARQLAERLAGDDVLFVATAQRGDDEMVERIERHQQSRPTTWRLLEVDRNVGAALQAQDAAAVTVIDCLTLLVSNLLCGDGATPEPDDVEPMVRREIDSILSVCRELPGVVILVSGEVGSGIVPVASLGRRFRDLLGGANKQIAEVADANYLLIAGRPIELNALATTLDQAAQRLDTESR